MRKIYTHKEDGIWSRAVSMSMATFVLGMIVGGMISMAIVSSLLR